MTLSGFLAENKTVVSLFAFYLGSAAISSLPVPQPGEGPFYQWFYKFANTLFANVSALRGKAQFDPKPDTQTQVTETHVATLTTAEVPKP